MQKPNRKKEQLQFDIWQFCNGIMMNNISFESLDLGTIAVFLGKSMTVLSWYVMLVQNPYQRTTVSTLFELRGSIFQNGFLSGVKFKFGCNLSNFCQFLT